ncbi:hypothetical protein CRE_09653 [Caenorhabditis remanei]|nr:hypothetical protein CRE_09653 [Caenorhabditis remanei]
MGSKHSTLKKKQQREQPVPSSQKPTHPVLSEEIIQATTDVNQNPPNIQPSNFHSPSEGSPLFNVNLSKIRSTDTIVGPNQAMKARSFNMTEVDFSIQGISSSFAPVPNLGNDLNNSKEKVDTCQADSPSPKRKVKKQKSPEDSEPPNGYYEAKKQKDRNRHAPSPSKSHNSNNKSTVSSTTSTAKERSPEKKKTTKDQQKKKDRRMTTVAHVDMGLANKGSTSVVGDDFWSPQNSEKMAPKHR